MEELRKGASLAEIQSYVAQMEIERGLADQNVVHKCLILAEEVVELFRNVRKQVESPISLPDASFPVAAELADVMIHLCAIANRYQIDLEAAFRDKERQNASGPEKANAHLQ